MCDCDDNGPDSSREYYIDREIERRLEPLEAELHRLRRERRTIEGMVCTRDLVSAVAIREFLAASKEAG